MLTRRLFAVTAILREPPGGVSDEGNQEEIMAKSDVPQRRAVSPWEPWGDLQSLAGRLDTLFGRPGVPGLVDLGSDVFTPLADIEETSDGWTVELELPGVAKEDVDVEVHGRTLVVTGERKEKERTGVMRRKTRVTGSFRYEVTLPGDLDEAKVRATLTDGELVVTVPKAATEQPRKVTVS